MARAVENGGKHKALGGGRAKRQTLSERIKLVRMQMLVTPQQAEFLRMRAKREKTSASDVNREILQKEIDESSVQSRMEKFAAIHGLWADRTEQEMQEYAEIRQSANRRLGAAD